MAEPYAQKSKVHKRRMHPALQKIRLPKISPPVRRVFYYRRVARKRK